SLLQKSFPEPEFARISSFVIPRQKSLSRLRAGGTLHEETEIQFPDLVLLQVPHFEAIVTANPE
ncbi:MAG: hypothetical protein O2856_00895, partial [Planctomycetota bacterium]|nr:hypothetical protein [Planctomycetota bacterium]